MRIILTSVLVLLASGSMPKHILKKRLASERDQISSTTPHPAAPHVEQATKMVRSEARAVSALASQPAWLHNAMMQDRRHPREESFITDLMRLAPSGALVSSGDEFTRAVKFWYIACVGPLRAGVAPAPCVQDGDHFVLTPERRRLIVETMEAKRKGNPVGFEWVLASEPVTGDDLPEPAKAAALRIVLRCLLSLQEWSPAQMRVRVLLSGLESVRLSEIIYMATLMDKIRSVPHEAYMLMRVRDPDMEKIAAAIMKPGGRFESDPKVAAAIAEIWMEHVLGSALVGVSRDGTTCSLPDHELRGVYRRLLESSVPAREIRRPEVRRDAVVADAILANPEVADDEVMEMLVGAGLRIPRESLAEARARIHRLFNAPVWFHLAILRIPRGTNPLRAEVIDQLLAAAPEGDLFKNRDFLTSATAVWYQFCASQWRARHHYSDPLACGPPAGGVVALSPSTMRKALEFFRDRLSVQGV